MYFLGPQGSLTIYLSPFVWWYDEHQSMARSPPQPARKITGFTGTAPVIGGFHFWYWNWGLPVTSDHYPQTPSEFLVPSHGPSQNFHTSLIRYSFSTKNTKGIILAKFIQRTPPKGKRDQQLPPNKEIHQAKHRVSPKQIFTVLLQKLPTFLQHNLQANTEVYTNMR